MIGRFGNRYKKVLIKEILVLMTWNFEPKTGSIFVVKTAGKIKFRALYLDWILIKLCRLSL